MQETKITRKFELQRKPLRHPMAILVYTHELIRNSHVIAQTNHYTPLKINMIHLKNTQLKGKSSEPNLHDFGFKMLIIHGAYLDLLDM